MRRGRNMDHEELEIEVHPTGKVTVCTVGIKGPRCVKATEFLTQLVGCEEWSIVTPEFYEENAASQRVDVRHYE